MRMDNREILGNLDRHIENMREALIALREREGHKNVCSRELAAAITAFEGIRLRAWQMRENLE